MFRLSRPAQSEISAFLEACSGSDFSYPDVGSTQGAIPSRYTIDHNRIGIGSGPNDLERAKTAIRQWKMFEMPWVELCWPDAPIEPGRTVAVVVRHLGFYSLNPARIVYVIDEPDRFGFAYGTLAGHGESGEERFLVEIDAMTGDVFYDLLAVSRPGHLLTYLGYPYTRYLQKQFALGSNAAMRRAIAA
ncbi:MAG TPA: DUF1990 domain-containing protein [Pyrinomonadaceae bacterium]|nr:DUF1990 domain-containing protein [Pyrinomonadaceae bacterium]HMP63963.1 DUF1990 domain-containing protein [Pyrinomonadaceae bacterium]